ncbi:hypothetical protein Zm00014a_011013 [Zea mays]|uniref:Uncharacterized protein n=1 Tax=Zea mays TaxID=4577 RepID=A0A3L6F5Y6_MAIZE|nr:hypothetical protein Zm00014a_011013 [Zea mays]
MEILTVEM